MNDTDKLRPTALGAWLKAATFRQSVEMCALAGVRRATVLLWANGAREMKIDSAVAIEKAVERINRREDGAGLPALRREHMKSECADCPYARACRSEHDN